MVGSKGWAGMGVLGAEEWVGKGVKEWWEPRSGYRAGWLVIRSGWL